MTLNADQQALIKNFSLGMVATVRADGGPAVSPKGTFLVLDPHRIGYADIRSPGTSANLRRDERVEVTFLDPFARKSVRVRGNAALHAAETETYGALIATWRSVWPDLAARARGLVIISVEHAQTILTPPYDDGATEEEMVAAYKAKYAEIYP